MLYNNRFSKMFRVIAPLFVMFALFAIITAFVQINTDKWEMAFFDLTISLIIVVGITSAVLQSGVAAIAALLPSKYMHVMVLGQV
ncbi:Equilibrative nucleoside transporter 3, partial [Stegodyphus mimosarum]